MSGHGTYDDFTNDQRTALAYAVNTAERGERDARMSQAVAFCNGSDDLAERYDGPTGHIARHSNARRELTGFLDLAYGVSL